MAMTRWSRVRLVTIGLLVLVFGSGVLLGMALDRSLGAAPAGGSSAERAEPRDRDGDDREERRRRLIIDEIEMEPPQRARVDSIVEAYRSRMRDLYRQQREEYEPRQRQLVSDTREAIKAELSESQAARYDSLLAERDRRRREHRNDDHEDDERRRR